MEPIILEIHKEFKRRLIEESYERIVRCTSKLSQEEIWKCPNDNLVSIGNLILHLNGNVKQWVLSGIANEKDSRNRNFEFDNRETLSLDGLLKELKSTIESAANSISKLTTEDLLKQRSVQCYNESTLSIIIHVIEHFSYHVGQITFYTKLLKNIDTAYYADDELDKLSN